MKYAKLAFLVLGLGLLLIVLRQTDLDELAERVQQVGLHGIAVVLLLYGFTFFTDVAGWNLTFETLPLSRVWLRRLYAVRMAGEAFNNITPMASMGGEPLKAVLLKSCYGIGFRESGASLVLAKTTNLIGLVLFLTFGFAMLVGSDVLHGPYKLVAAAGLALLGASTAGCFLIQRLRMSSLAGTRLGRTKFGHRISHWLAVVKDIDDKFLRFYSQHRRRFAAVVGLAVVNWSMGVIEIYWVMHLLGYPLTLTEALIIESMVQLVKAGTFFIPAALGSQEAALLVVAGAITGDPVSAIAFGLIRRCREIVWIVAGLGVWSLLSFGKPAPRPRPKPPGSQARSEVNQATAAASASRAGRGA